MIFLGSKMEIKNLSLNITSYEEQRKDFFSVCLKDNTLHIEKSDLLEGALKFSNQDWSNIANLIGDKLLTSTDQAIFSSNSREWIVRISIYKDQNNNKIHFMGFTETDMIDQDLGAEITASCIDYILSKNNL